MTWYSSGCLDFPTKVPTVAKWISDEMAIISLGKFLALTTADTSQNIPDRSEATELASRPLELRDICRNKKVVAIISAHQSI
jgi:hypothetical protein